MSDTQEQVREAPAPAKDVEARARAMGWKPKDEYRGPPDKWREAEAFVEHGERELPVLRERFRKQEHDFASLRARQDEAISVITDLTERTRRAEERGYKKALAELEAKRDQAIRDGDVDAVRAADKEREELAKDAPKAAPTPKAPPQAPAAATPHPDTIAWDAKNPWFRQDPELQGAAVGIHERLLTSEPHLTIAQNLERVTAAMRVMFPTRVPAARQEPRSGDGDEGENPRRREAPSVSASSPNAGPQRQNARSFDAMPKDSKEAYARYTRQLEGKGKPLTKEEWAETYWSQEG